ncbi:SixA phosphatase family protein [Flavihumibacter petaseus]|uniref:Phosphohistidine phosphatase n=1 Tax=Flavihumibacter petaseus NBRC 106054 TaxID=1220578 RepID=A0A0E9MZB5_9BACT|nr:histidine phosphatase family protein [Flavihumibacter petaseus]GAO42440.1 hypothetical protein FPE01S_01_14550 [Flavihumibacter petaseus NBRC 106054]
MKSIYVVRHAKSSWGDLTLPDFDRPLNDRGQRNAPEMAQRLLQKGVAIDLFVSSTAKRALQTAMHFARAYQQPAEVIQLHEELYHAPASVYSDVISTLDDKASSVAIFGHNPGISFFVNELCSTRIDEMPTCGVFAVSAPISHWADFPAATKSFLFFERP